MALFDHQVVTLAEGVLVANHPAQHVDAPVRHTVLTLDQFDRIAEGLERVEMVNQPELEVALLAYMTRVIAPERAVWVRQCVAPRVKDLDDRVSCVQILELHASPLEQFEHDLNPEGDGVRVHDVGAEADFPVLVGLEGGPSGPRALSSPRR